jgi:primosomal protein N' (replication factor Y)
MERRVAPTKPPAELTAEADRLRARTPKSIAARVLSALAGGEVTLAEAHSLGATTTHLRTLEAGGWLQERQVRMVRDPLAGFAFDRVSQLVLNPAQQAAADVIAGAPGGVHVLHGVTGSGKTEVYLDLVRRTLTEGRSAIVLVPEIGLTPQAIRRYGERFAETLTVLHSRLGTGELFDQWYRIESGDARLVLGSRSALFAPAKDLGLIVLDEEHEWTYKQTDQQPRYHAREAARELARLTGATLVLGSATPSITTYYETQSGNASLHVLHQRVSPQDDGSTIEGRHALVQVVDMREELRAGNRSVFSFPLKRAVRAALEAGEQSILFVNRRGAARFVLCRACGFVPQCPSCKLPVSLDASNPLQPLLRCHHCGRGRRMEERCPSCDSNKYRPFGVGTQRIEQDARLQFPGARVARWDSDTASRKGSHEQIVRALEAGDIDILVGTQVLAKGLDLPEMTVVGVVDADVGLSLPDYHAGERAFQLLSQVAGRAGRRDKPGYVYFQTYQPEAMPIRCAAEHDYAAFYEYEIAHRRRAGYPPFSRLARLLYRDMNNEHALQETSRVAEAIRLARDAAGRADPEVLGPNPSYIARLRGEYRWQIVLRGRDPASALRDIRLGERWAVDIDPASLL